MNGTARFEMWTSAGDRDEQLQLPVQRAVRMMQTVEASCRLDAIASAGFGLSRAKIVDHVKQGRLRLNWKNVRQPSRELTVGDRLHLQDRGSLEVTALNRTKRDRWRRSETQLIRLRPSTATPTRSIDGPVTHVLINCRAISSG